MKRKFVSMAAVAIISVMLMGCQNGNEDGAANETQNTEASQDESGADSTETETTEEGTDTENDGTDAETDAQAEDSTPDETADAADAQEQTVGGWKITFEDMVSDGKLENVSTELGYSDVTTSEFKKEASAGKKFCLMKFIFEKVDSKEVIDWEKMVLKDENGTEYKRIDDAFLNDLGMKRLSGTELNFGTNEGWIAFEVDESAENLTVEYPFEGEVYSQNVQ